MPTFEFFKTLSSLLEHIHWRWVDNACLLSGLCGLRLGPQVAYS